MKTWVIGRSGAACCATSLLGGIASVMAMSSAGAAVVYHSSSRSVTWLPVACSCGMGGGTCPPQQNSTGGTGLFCVSSGVNNCGGANQCSELQTQGIYGTGGASGSRQSQGDQGGGRSELDVVFSVTTPTEMVLRGGISARQFFSAASNAMLSFSAGPSVVQSWSVQSQSPVPTEAAIDYTIVLQPGINYRILARAWAGSPGNASSSSSATWGFTASMPRACDLLDFNFDGIFGDPTDIEAFISRYSGGPCIGSNFCGDLDFNNDGIVQDPTDIESFLSVYSGGPCL